MRTENRTALITGGVSGLGFGIARAYARDGFSLILTYRNEDYRRQAEQWFDDAGLPQPDYQKLDVANREEWAALRDKIGPLHVLVNNAGVSVFGPTDEASYADYDWIMGVNFGGIVNSLVTLLPKIKADCAEADVPGHVVNVASMAAYLSGPQAGIYTASKFAVRGLTECLRYNLAPHNIGVSLMCPGLTKTNAWDSALKRPSEYAQSGFAEVDKDELEQFGTAFDAGMDPLEVGEKTLQGMKENRPIIFSHPEFADDFEAIYRESLAALPDEPVPPARQRIEEIRRSANKAAAEGSKIGLSDLT